MASEKSETGTTEVSGGGAISDEELEDLEAFIASPVSERGLGGELHIASYAPELIARIRASEAWAEAAERDADYLQTKWDAENARALAAEAERDELKLAIREYFSPNEPSDHFAEFFDVQPQPTPSDQEAK